jgi:hypothetical protein
VKTVVGDEAVVEDGEECGASPGSTPRAALSGEAVVEDGEEGGVSPDSTPGAALGDRPHRRALRSRGGR